MLITTIFFFIKPFITKTYYKNAIALQESLCIIFNLSYLYIFALIYLFIYLLAQVFTGLHGRVFIYFKTVLFFVYLLQIDD